MKIINGGKIITGKELKEHLAPQLHEFIFDDEEYKIFDDGHYEIVDMMCERWVPYTLQYEMVKKYS